MRSSQRQAERKARGVARSVAQLGVPCRGSRPGRGTRRLVALGGYGEAEETATGSGAPPQEDSSDGQGLGAALAGDSLQVILKELATMVNNQVAAQVAAALQGSVGYPAPAPTAAPAPQPPASQAEASASGIQAEAATHTSTSQATDGLPGQVMTSVSVWDQAALGEFSPPGPLVAGEVWGAQLSGGQRHAAVIAATPPQQATPVLASSCRECRSCDCMSNPVPCRACRSCDCQLSPTGDRPTAEPATPMGSTEVRKEDCAPPPGLYAPSYAPLGWHLAPAVKEKIGKGEFVDMFSLMLREPDPEPKAGECPGAQLGIRKHKVDRNWDNWVCGYMAFAGTVLRKEPNKGMMLFKYFDLINRLRKNHGGAGWARYDDQFRMRFSDDPRLSWYVKDQEIWSQLVVTGRDQDDWAPSGHLFTKSAEASRPYGTTAKQRVQPPGICFLFNSQGNCNRQECSYQHACSTCGGRHAARFCGSAKGGWNWKRRGAGKKHNGGSGGEHSSGTAQAPPPQGAKPN